MSVKSLAISIPAFNEAEALPGVIEEARRTLDELGIEGEILVIDDGSTDATGRIAADWAARDPRVKVLRHEKNLGFGTTIKEVYTVPSKQWVFCVPGDGQIPVAEVKRLLPYVDDSPFILGWRKRRADPWPRKVQAGVYNALISLVMGQRVHDVDSVALARKDLVEKVSLNSRSVFLHAELALKIRQTGADILEIPIEHRERRGGNARGARPGTIALTIWELIRYVATRS